MSGKPGWKAGTSSASPLGRDLLLALGLASGPAVALGMARFAYALLLPSMQDALRWSFTTAALMNTANAGGYLTGALVAATLSHRIGARPVFLGGLAVTSTLLLASAATGNLAVLLALRTLAGVSGAATFIVGGATAAQLGHGKPSSRAPLLLGVYFSGGGLGVALSGLVVPALLADTSLSSGWRWGWVALAIASALAGMAAAPAVRRSPVPEPNNASGRLRLRSIRILTVSYGLYGAGYIAYMTFIVSYLRSAGAGTGEISAFWVVLGLAAIAGGFLWGPVLARLRAGTGPAVVVACVAAGALLPVLSRTPLAAFASAVLFGASFLAVVTAVANTARAALPPAQWTAAIGVLTTGFALGQCAGPVLSGLLDDTSGGVKTGFVLSVAILAAAALGCLVCRERPAASGAVHTRTTAPSAETER